MMGEFPNVSVQRAKVVHTEKSRNSLFDILENSHWSHEKIKNNQQMKAKDKSILIK